MTITRDCTRRGDTIELGARSRVCREAIIRSIAHGMKLADDDTTAALQHVDYDSSKASIWIALCEKLGTRLELAAVVDCQTVQSGRERSSRLCRSKGATLFWFLERCLSGREPLFTIIVVQHTTYIQFERWKLSA